MITKKEAMGVKCKQCGQDLPKDAKTCPACGKKRSAATLWIILIITGALLLVLGIGMVLLLIGGSIAAVFLFWPNRANKVSVQRPVNGIVEQAGLPAENPYAQCFDTYAEYVLPESNRRYLGQQDLDGLTDQALFIGLQEIYARQGMTFSDPDVQAYFNARSWYTAGTDTDDSNTYEKANAVLLETTLFLRSHPADSSDNPYIRKYTRSYLFPDSHTRFLSAQDLKDCSATELLLARGEILARKGVVFTDADLQMYFCTKSWYQPQISEEEIHVDMFNDREKSNLTLIGIYEKRCAGVTFSQDNPYAAAYDAGRDYVFPDSNTRELSDSDLFALSPSMYVLARNEIMARHGYTFSDPDLLEYFLHYSWYLPNTPAGNAEGIVLSAVEQRNVQLLKQQQDLFEQIPDVSQVDKTLNLTVTAPGFTLQMPNYWADCAQVSITDRGVRFQERFSKDTAGGHLFTLTLYPDTTYTELPSYDLVGYLEDGTGNAMYLVAQYPTDVQFCTAAAELYAQMDGQIPAILQTICAVPGYTYTPA